MTSGTFHGETVYKESYVGHIPQQVILQRPKTVFKPENNTFSAETEYSKGFPKKEKIYQPAYNEKPSRTYDLLYPDKDTIPKMSVKNIVHNGRKGERSEICMPKNSKVNIGTEGEFDHSTTNGVQFKQYDIPERTKSMKPGHKIVQREKFASISQNRVDFQYDETEAANSRAKKCEEYPSLIKLSMDAPTNFNTVTSMSYNNWQSENFKKSTISAKPSARYTPPKQKFEVVSQSHSDYKNYGVKRRVGLIHPPEQRISSAKISGESSYNTHFKNHGIIERKLYGDQHEDNIHLPPSCKKFEASTVMKSDFGKKNVKKQAMCKPSYSLQNAGEFNTATEYNETFKPMAFQPCTFTKFMAEMKARKQTVN